MSYRLFLSQLPSNFLTLLFVLCTALQISAQDVVRKRTTMLMGGRFDITIVAADSLQAERNIDIVIEEIDRIENLISDWKPVSQISLVNQNAGIKPVKVDQEVFELTKRALQLSKETAGAFDISFAALDKIWKFDGSMTEMPSEERIKRSIRNVGYEKIILDSANGTIFLKQAGMKIGFGALGEGYATNRCQELMIARGIKSGIINGSGDMSTWGKQPSGEHWNIGITNPFKPNDLYGVIALKEGAVTTSGSYEKFAIIDGKRYSHIINPVTAYPASGLCSVTVFGPNAEFCNGFSTSAMVLGKDKAIDFLNRQAGYSYLIITDSGKIIKSKNLMKIKKVK